MGATVPGGGPAGESRAAWALLPGPRSVAAYGAGPCSPKFIPLIQAISAAEPTITPPGSASSGVLERARAAVILEWHRRGRPGPAGAVRRHPRERLRRSRPSPRAGAP